MSTEPRHFFRSRCSLHHHRSHSFVPSPDHLVRVHRSSLITSPITWNQVTSDESPDARLSHLPLKVLSLSSGQFVRAHRSSLITPLSSLLHHFLLTGPPGRAS